MSSFIIVEKIRSVINNLDVITAREKIDLIENILSEYDELFRLFKWREDIIKSGADINKYHNEFKKIEEKLINAGFYVTDDYTDLEIRKMFNE